MKILDVPFIGDLEKMSGTELETALELSGAKELIGTANWKADFGYQPSCLFSLAHSETALAVLYQVRGLDLRATVLTDNGAVWEDSCCEFFVAAPDGSGYYNFEMNCIGSLLGAFGAGRTGRRMKTPEELARVRRFSSLPHRRYEESDRIFSWQVMAVLPLDLFGADRDTRRLRANFYKCGDRTAHPHFLSWNPIDAPKPDFHRPECFGTLRLCR